jgi:hypothetical protein
MSKPQLVIQDFGGEHNKDLDKTYARVMRGATWKKQRVVVVIPSSDLIPAKVALSHWNLFFPPNNGVARILALGQEVGEAYSNAIESILAHPDLSQWEFILTVENDNCPPADGVIKLVELMEAHPEFACIGGLYFTKGIENSVAQIWGDPRDPCINFRPQPPDPNGGLVECCGTGMGFNLWRLSMFKDSKLRRPWFKTLNGKDGVGLGTQDLFFWGDARKYGYRCAVACNVKTGHYDLEGKFGIPDFMY